MYMYYNAVPTACTRSTRAVITAISLYGRTATNGDRNAKYGPYSQIRKYSGLYFAVFTVKKAKYMPPNSYLVAPKFVFDCGAI